MSDEKRFIAQINIARFRLPPEDPANAGFMAALDHVNATAEASDGFVWRMIGEGDHPDDAGLLRDEPRMIVNMTVWRDIASLERFAYRQPDHVAVLRRRGEWFEQIEPSLALWWVAPDHRPSMREGFARLAELAKNGPGESVFTFRSFRRV